MQSNLSELLLFDRFKPFYAHFVMRMKAHGGFTTRKPSPIQQCEVKRCAEAAQSGSITMLYARIVAYIKWLHGCRNPVFAAWTWGQMKFVPTVVFEEGCEEGKV